MGWKGTLRAMQADQRRQQREVRRRQRELQTQRKELQKMQELARAAYEVDVYENHIDVLLSVHKDCGDAWDWEEIKSSEPPPPPAKTDVRASRAQAELDGYKPGIFDKLLSRAEAKQITRAKAVETAKREDQKEYENAIRVYERDYIDWQGLVDVAGKIHSGDWKAYFDAITQTNPFGEISELGSSIRVEASQADCVEATLRVNGEDVIPNETKSLLQSGKLSTKKMPKGRFFELYQDYVCGCVLRVARELFALLPIHMVIITAVGNILNTQTGHMEEQPILSVAIPRNTLEALNFDTLDPSDCLANFLHRMAFRKTKGFNPVEALKRSDLQPTNVD